jgi:plastocyanin
MVAIAMAVAGCSAASLAQEKSDTATVTGIVKFKGPKPERKPNEGLLGQAFCKEACAGKAPLEEKWVFGKNGDDDTFANVLVYVSKGLEGKKFDPPKEHVVLDQVGCLYTPHVVSVMVGQTLEIRNSDATLHNVLCNPFKNKPFNEGMPIKGGKIEKIFTTPELKMDLRCVLHPWMLAYVHVLDHPFHAVTREDGAFTIKGLPAGEYELSVKHESSRFAAEPATVSIKVGAGETKKIEFVYTDKQ